MTNQPTTTPLSTVPPETEVETQQVHSPPKPKQKRRFVAPRLTKQGKVAALTQGGFGGSLP